MFCQSKSYSLSLKNQFNQRLDWITHPFMIGVPQTPLHLATYLKLPEVVKQLVEKGAGLELQDQEGNTALHVACQHGQTECATEMTRDVSPSKMAPVLEIQNWRGEENTDFCITAVT